MSNIFLITFPVKPTRSRNLNSDDTICVAVSVNVLLRSLNMKFKFKTITPLMLKYGQIHLGRQDLT